MRTVPFLVALGVVLSGAAPAVADLRPSSALKIPISKRGLDLGALLQEGTDLIDTGKVKAHLQHLKQKYSRLTNKHVKRSGTGIVPLTDEKQESYWAGTMQVGTPYQELLVNFDTGSADLIVSRPAYDPAASSTAKDTGDTFSESYADGTNATGSIYTDSIKIGGLTAKAVTIGRASDDYYEDSGVNTLAGMALPQMSTFKQQTPFWKSLADQAKMQPVFSFHLAQAGSTLMLGAAGPSPSYVDVSSAYGSPGYWMVNGTLAGSKGLMLVDSGTTLIIAPPEMAKQIFKTLGMTPATEKDDDTIYGTFPCDKPPPFSFEFGTKTVDVVPTAQVWGKWDDGSCVSTIIGVDTTGTPDVVIAGDPLFESSVITFDFFTTSPRVGFS